MKQKELTAIYDDFKLPTPLISINYAENIHKYLSALTLSILTLHCHLHTLQAANCCRNSRLVVDEDDLKWVKKLKKITMY